MLLVGWLMLACGAGAVTRTVRVGVVLGDGEREEEVEAAVAAINRRTDLLPGCQIRFTAITLHHNNTFKLRNSGALHSNGNITEDRDRDALYNRSASGQLKV